MKRVRWQQIRATLREQCQPPPLRSADEFWADFRARQQLVPQIADDPLAVPPRFAVSWLPALTGLAIVALVAVLFTKNLHTPPPTPVQAARLSEVEEVEVMVEYGGLMIMQDAESRGTLVWVTGMETHDG